MNEEKPKRILRPTEGSCIFCGAFGRRTQDHVPPKCLFPSRVHSSLPNLWTCTKCNSGWQRDGEYVRDMLLEGALKDSSHSDLAEIRETYERAKKSREERGKNPSVFWSKVPGVDKSVNLRRIGNVIGITAYAINLHATKGAIPIPPDTRNFRIAIQDILPDSEHFATAMNLLSSGNRSFGKGLITYCDFIREDDPSEQEWLIAFYDTAVFHLRQGRSETPALKSILFANTRVRSTPNSDAWRHFVSDAHGGETVRDPIRARIRKTVGPV